ncbi:apoptosis-associated speck-like protein containing a CARD, partial [Pundamilia nyererei]|uniref:Apoptosis-associated speck-like protein containing a CARD n=1 Tax=Pundamilia nyererei TaxID=303518 RepID=A0A9Y6M397_9CICH
SHELFFPFNLFPFFPGKHFVDKHRVQLIQRVSNVAPILDDLLGSDVISQESYHSIMALPTSQDKMRTLYSHLNTERCNDIFYKILLENEKHLIDEFSAK